MDDLVPVAILDSTDNLLEKSSGLCLRHLSMLDNVIEQFAAGELEDHDNLGLCLDDGVPSGVSVSNHQQTTSDNESYSLMM